MLDVLDMNLYKNAFFKMATKKKALLLYKNKKIWIILQQLNWQQVKIVSYSKPVLEPELITVSRHSPVSLPLLSTRPSVTFTFPAIVQHCPWPVPNYTALYCNRCTCVWTTWPELLHVSNWESNLQPLNCESYIAPSHHVTTIQKCKSRVE